MDNDRRRKRLMLTVKILDMVEVLFRSFMEILPNILEELNMHC